MAFTARGPAGSTLRGSVNTDQEQRLRRFGALQTEGAEAEAVGCIPDSLRETVKGGEPGALRSTASQRAGHDVSTTRRKHYMTTKRCSAVDLEAKAHRHRASEGRTLKEPHGSR